MLYRIAASVAIIAVISTLYFTLSDRQLKEFPGAPEVSEAVSEDDSVEEMPAASNESGEKTISQSKTQQTEASIPRPVEERKNVEGNIVTREKKPEQKEDAFVYEMEDYDEVLEEIDLKDVEQEDVAVAHQVQHFAVETKEETVTRAIEAPAAVPEMERGAISRSLAAKKAILTGSEGTGKEMAITGRVISSEDSLPIPGASIVIQGTTKGILTDAEGRFVMPLDSVQPIDLQVNFIGMDPYETRAERSEELKIVMEPSVQSLSEVIVVGSALRANTFNTGAVSEIKELDAFTGSRFTGAYPKEGYPAFKEYLRKNMVLPDSLSEKAVVVLKFVVLPNGRPSEINVIRSPGEVFSMEAIRLLKEGPDWVPAMSEGRFVDVETRMRMRMDSSGLLGDPLLEPL